MAVGLQDKKPHVKKAEYSNLLLPPITKLCVMGFGSYKPAFSETCRLNTQLEIRHALWRKTRHTSSHRGCALHPATPSSFPATRLELVPVFNTHHGLGAPALASTSQLRSVLRGEVSAPFRLWGSTDQPHHCPSGSPSPPACSWLRGRSASHQDSSRDPETRGQPQPWEPLLGSVLPHSVPL